MLGTRRDRLLILLLLGALLSADFYFHLWPQMRRRLGPATETAEPQCSCPAEEAALTAGPKLRTRTPANLSSQAPHSKLRRLFAHPLYSTPERPAEKLLNGQEALRYYRRKIARWNRIIIDLKNENWYQKCHDPICRAENFKSESFPLPVEVCLPFLFKEDEEYVGTIGENNTDQSANTVDTTGLLDNIPFTSVEENSKPNKKSSNVEWDHELDACLLEASEDVELIEATDIFHTQRNYTVDEIPDELLTDVFLKN